MHIIKKKNVLNELALSLFLMLEFSPLTTTPAVLERIIERAKEALATAVPYTGVIGENDVREFLKVKPLNFSIYCGKDIIKRDTIRFVEPVFDNQRKPSRQLGFRGIIAEVTSIHNGKGDNPILNMRVISSGGVGQLKPDISIRRTLKAVVKTEVRRVAWENELKREESKTKPEDDLSEIKRQAKEQILANYSVPKRSPMKRTFV